MCLGVVFAVAATAIGFRPAAGAVAVGSGHSG